MSGNRAGTASRNRGKPKRQTKATVACPKAASLGCSGCILFDVLNHKLGKGEKPVCLECKKLGRKTEYRSPGKFLPDKASPTISLKKAHQTIQQLQKALETANNKANSSEDKPVEDPSAALKELQRQLGVLKREKMDPAIIQIHEDRIAQLKAKNGSQTDLAKVEQKLKAAHDKLNKRTARILELEKELEEEKKAGLDDALHIAKLKEEEKKLIVAKGYAETDIQQIGLPVIPDTTDTELRTAMEAEEAAFKQKQRDELQAFANQRLAKCAEITATTGGVALPTAKPDQEMEPPPEDNANKTRRVNGGAAAPADQNAMSEQQVQQEEAERERLKQEAAKIYAAQLQAAQINVEPDSDL